MTLDQNLIHQFREQILDSSDRIATIQKLFYQCYAEEQEHRKRKETRKSAASSDTSSASSASHQVQIKVENNDDDDYTSMISDRAYEYRAPLAPLAAAQNAPAAPPALESREKRLPPYQSPIPIENPEKPFATPKPKARAMQSPAASSRLAAPAPAFPRSPISPSLNDDPFALTSYPTHNNKKILEKRKRMNSIIESAKGLAAVPEVELTEQDKENFDDIFSQRPDDNESYSSINLSLGFGDDDEGMPSPVAAPFLSKVKKRM